MLCCIDFYLKLNLISDPPLVSMLPNFNPYIVELGDTKTLSCSVTEANPSVISSYTWSDKGTGSTANIQTSDGGTYTCVANNGITGAVPVSKDVQVQCRFLTPSEYKYDLF